MRDLTILLCKVEQVCFQDGKMYVYVKGSSMEWLLNENVFILSAKVAKECCVESVEFTGMDSLTD